MALPRIARTQLRWFARYVRYYLKRNFHAVHLLRLEEFQAVGGRPLLICSNHPSWWDPLLGLYVSQTLLADRACYSPIAADGLAKYRFFERLGFFGIEGRSRVGAARFLEVGSEVLGTPGAALWVTAQGRFADVRERPCFLQGGVGHLARRSRGVAMLPVAFEYAFWNERHPEAFVAIGQPVMVEGGSALAHEEWTRLFARALEETQDRLSAAVVKRDAAAFEPLLQGAAGVGGVYDVWRRWRARARGEAFHAGHGRI